MQEWSPKTTNLKPDLSSMPIWMDFKGVPDHLFTEVGLRFLGDVIGASIKLHPNTLRCIRLDVVRVLVVANLEKRLPNSISLNPEEENLIQVSYHWLPSRCNSWGRKDSEWAQMKMGSVVIQNKEKHSEKIGDKMTSGNAEKVVVTSVEVINVSMAPGEVTSETTQS